MNSIWAMPACPLCKAPAHRVSWRSGRGGRGGPVEVTVQPCGHVVTCAAPPEIVLDPVVERRARPA
ncbi:hypothetical protein [Streptomyces bambusae]|uniref:Ferredoxin n=1 Tax=Streptomyces bambusae TaxID=1550616 RepID=A0ABS6ZF60_9ACTN|nr:hypothetical protein [Streptomyces bambusae]MBW5486371.1 hypothetical protein [Streptomyces bambusae]